MKKTRFKVSPIPAHLAEKPPGLYQRGPVWWFTWRQNGEKKYTSLHTSDYAEAVNLAARIRACPTFQSGSRITDELTRYLAEKEASGHHSRHTGEWAETPIKQFAEFTGNKNVDAVSKEDVSGFWNALRKRMAETSAASYMRALRSFFSWLLKSRHAITRHPFDGFTLPKVAEAARVVFCEGPLREQLIAKAPTWDLQWILYAGMHAGLRMNEIIEARPEWLDLERGFIAVERTATFRPKDRERRSVPMTNAFLKFLRGSEIKGPFVLKPEVKHGRAIFRYDFRLPFMTYMKAQGCDGTGQHPRVTPHTMRHTFGALYVSDGGSLFRLANYLGDTLDVTEKHYAHLSPDRDDIERGHGVRKQAKRKPAAASRAA